MTWKNNESYIRRCIELSINAQEKGNMPFGALLVNEDGEIILEQENIEVTDSICTGHAETQLMVKGSKKYDKDFLWNCTLYTIAEPCVMCSGAIYWGNVGRVVYGISERRLLSLTGSNELNPTFDLPCREVFAKGQKDIEVIGPISEVEKEILVVHKNFWTNN